jgi:hypothetical protein
MRLFLKILTAPVVGVLTLAVAFSKFVIGLSDIFFGIVSGVVFIMSVVILVTDEAAGGIAWMVIAFLVSPFGIPALAGWLVDRLDDFNSLIKSL